MTNRAPRLHFMPDMDWQEKSKTQTVSPYLQVEDSQVPVFADFRAMRKPVAGSIARDQLDIDTEMNKGIKQDYTPTVSVTTASGPVRTSLSSNQDEEPAAAAEDVSMYVTTFPEGIEIIEEFLARGQELFNIYCTACHGYSGNGDGLVNDRALALAATGKASWTAAKSLHDATVKDAEKNPVGRIFDTITNGRSTMGPYGNQIPVNDRWAIVAYVKALQETGIEPVVAAVAEAPAEEAKTDDANAEETKTEDAKAEDGELEIEGADNDDDGANPKP